MGLYGISSKGLEKGRLLILGVILMWVCLKTGLQSDLKFIKPPISSSDDREGSWLLVSWSSRWFPVLSTSKEAGKECGCMCLKGAWEVSLTSLNAGTQMSGVSFPKATILPCVQAPMSNDPTSFFQPEV